MKILHVPHPILKTKCRKVVKFDPKLEKIVSEMTSTLKIQKNPDCVGLAGNQVGLDMAIFIMRPKKEDPITFVANPVILECSYAPQKKGKKIKDRLKFEGCMSIPHIWGKLKREDTVLLKYQDIKGNWTQKWFRGFPAQIVLHEVDHLEGILFTERTLSQGQTLYKDGPNDTLEPLEI